MPLPLILGGIAAVAAAGGIGAGINGAVKLKNANETIEDAKFKMGMSQERVKYSNTKTSAVMDDLGVLELNILKSFSKFSDVIEKIQNRPQFENVTVDGVKLPKYNPEEIKDVSVGAGVLMGGLGGAALGTAGGFAAAGLTTAAVMALGTASTGTAIASLSGAAATNATLAAIGGGAIAAGGGGIALGTTILGASTLGVGLLIGGVIFSFAGSSVSDKADEAYRQAKQAEEKADKICTYLDKLKETAEKYCCRLRTAKNLYESHLNKLRKTVIDDGKTDWYTFTPEEKLNTENTVMLVALLYEMCKVNLVIKAKDQNSLNAINPEVYAEGDKALKICNNLAPKPHSVESLANPDFDKLVNEGISKNLTDDDANNLVYCALYYYLTRDYNKMISLPMFSKGTLSEELAREIVKMKYISPMLIGDMKEYLKLIPLEKSSALLKQVTGQLEAQSAMITVVRVRLKSVEDYIRENLISNASNSFAKLFREALKNG